jgi:hypothetical protein
MKRSFVMRFAGIALFATLFLASLGTSALAQSAWPEDPFSELLRSFSSGQPAFQDSEQTSDERQTIHRARHRNIERMRPHPTAERNRVIRAKAEVTIIDRDHIVVKLTRRGIGAANGSGGNSGKYRAIHSD